MTKLIILFSAAAIAGVPGWNAAHASVKTTLVPNCAQPYESVHNADLDQNQIFVLESHNCSGRFTVHVSLTAQAQKVPAEKDEVSVSIHDIFSRQGDQVFQTGPDLCEGRPGASDGHFDNASVSCSETRALSPGQSSELRTHYFTDGTKNAHIETWWSYQPGL